MSNKAITGLWTPTGYQALDGAQPERVELRPGVGEWLRQFADVAEHLKLAVLCEKCQAPLLGKNSESAQVFSVVCKCREFIWHNRDYKVPTEFDFYQH